MQKHINGAPFDMPAHEDDNLRRSTATLATCHRKREDDDYFDYFRAISRRARHQNFTGCADATAFSPVMPRAAALRDFFSRKARCRAYAADMSACAPLFPHWDAHTASNLSQAQKDISGRCWRWRGLLKEAENSRHGNTSSSGARPYR